MGKFLDIAKSVPVRATTTNEQPPLREKREKLEGFLPDGLTLNAFASSGRVLRIYSQVLNEEVLLAANNAAVSPSETRTVYRASEMSELLGISPEGLRLLHEVKTAFSGAVILTSAESEALPTTVANLGFDY